MEKRTVIVTGGNSGLGYQCAKNIAMKDKDYTLVLACRNPEKAAKAIQDMKAETGNENIHSVALDLASLDSVRAFKELYKKENFPPLYSIVCNAGLNRTPLEYTKDGFEMTFGVCHLGHFLLVNEMLDMVAEDGRIVFVASDMHRPPIMMSLKAPAFTDAYKLAYLGKNEKPSGKDMNLRYSMAKLSNILCVYEMADRLNAAGKKIMVNAFNPGLMTDTNFMPTGSKVQKALISAGSTMVAKLTNRYGSGLTSGKELAKMVTEESFEGVTGKYNDRGTITKTSEPSYDKKAAKKLWEQSVELLKMNQDEMIQ